MEKTKRYDLEERTFEFAKRVRAFLRTLPPSVSNIEDAKQLARSSGSVGANYIEANEALSRRDFMMHIKICRKESKETAYWLRLVGSEACLIQESVELMKIFGAILHKCE